MTPPRQLVPALGVPAGICNVVEDEPMRRRDVGNGIARLLGVSPPRFVPVWMANIGGGVGRTLARSLRIWNRKLKAAGTWNPRFATLADGLAAMIADGSRYHPGSASSARGGACWPYARPDDAASCVECRRRAEISDVDRVTAVDRRLDRARCPSLRAQRIAAKTHARRRPWSHLGQRGGCSAESASDRRGDRLRLQ